MKKSTRLLTTLGIAVLICAFYARPKTNSGSVPAEQKIVQMSAVTPRQERVEPKTEKQTKTIPVKFRIKASFVDPAQNK